MEIGDRGDRPPGIGRNALRSILLASVPKQKMPWNIKVQVVKKDTDDSNLVCLVTVDELSGFA